MIIEIFPEDMLLEYVEKLLFGHTLPYVKHIEHLDKLPQTIEFSEEFLEKWKSLVKTAIIRLVADIFGTRQFIFEENGYVKRHSALEPAFWEHITLNFSHRSAERLYEQMTLGGDKTQESVLLALPEDALFIALCTNNFSAYSFQWLQKNKASWLTKALFIMTKELFIHDSIVFSSGPSQYIHYRGEPGQVGWLVLLSDPASTELPLREFLVECCAHFVNEIANWIIRAFSRPGYDLDLNLPRPYEGIEIKMTYEPQNLASISKHFFGFKTKMEAAFAAWQDTATVAVDDARYISGVIAKFAIISEAEKVTRHINMILKNANKEEKIYESLIRGQNSSSNNT